VSQPTNKTCEVPLPGELDAELEEFWIGNPWKIAREENLSSFERNRAYLNANGENFFEVSHISGADTDADGRSVIAVDFRNTGQLDLVVRSVGGGPLRIYENQLPPRNHLKVTLRGTRSNRLGLGARILAQVGDQQMVREMYPINTYRSQAPAMVHFGLGEATTVDRLVIQWPSGEDQVFENVEANRSILIREGKDAIRPYPRPARSDS